MCPFEQFDLKAPDSHSESHYEGLVSGDQQTLSRSPAHSRFLTRMYGPACETRNTHRGVLIAHQLSDYERAMAPVSRLFEA